MPIEPELTLITQTEARRHARVSYQTLHVWRRKGLLTTYRMPGRRLVFIDLAELNRIMTPVAEK